MGASRDGFLPPLRNSSPALAARPRRRDRAIARRYSGLARCARQEGRYCVADVGWTDCVAGGQPRACHAERSLSGAVTLYCYSPSVHAKTTRLRRFDLAERDPDSNLRNQSAFRGAFDFRKHSGACGRLILPHCSLKSKSTNLGCSGSVSIWASRRPPAPPSRLYHSPPDSASRTETHTLDAIAGRANLQPNRSAWISRTGLHVPAAWRVDKTKDVVDGVALPLRSRRKDNWCVPCISRRDRNSR